jgi:hypothetical protein
MLGVAQYHTIPLPKGWPRRVRSAIIHVISLARVARTPGPFFSRIVLKMPYNSVGGFL